jgi:antitoxin (DNA-binding transcriptional repressor) of toxin-antitoxin stability system
MVKTPQESQAELGDLVERASQGEEVLIAVDGQVKARLTAASPAPVRPRPDMKAIAENLRAHLYDGYTGKLGPPIEEMLEEMREERF